MSSYTKKIGTIGEQVLITEFIKNDISVLKPVGDNDPFDFIIIINNNYLKVQVKTTEHIKDNRMVFCTNITNPFQKSSRKYTDKEIDLFGLYCIENGFIGLLPISEYSSKETIIRIKPSQNNQTKNVKMMDDYLFNVQLKNIINYNK